MSEQRFEYVGFWARVGATLIDTVILLLITLPSLWAINRLTTSGFVNGVAELLISWIAPAVIVIALWLHKAATPGKMIFSARVVDASTGMPLTLGQAVGRYLAYFVSVVPLMPGPVLGRLRRQEAGVARQACWNGCRSRQAVG